VAVIAAALSLVLTVVAFATGNRPVLAALAMAAVALLTSLAAAAGPLSGALGFLGSLAYFLVATMARVANLFEVVSLRWAAAHIAAGYLGGLLVVFVGTAWRRRQESDEVKAAGALPIQLRSMWASLRSFDEHARDGLRRAISLAILTPTGAVGNWAERRLVDGVVGCAVALIATYLLWPRDREVKEPVPAPT
jgi:hypothetical protein